VSVFFYNLLWFFLFPFLFFLLPLISLFAGKERSGLLQRLGIVPIDKKKFYGKKVIWIQALSVGEITTAGPVVAELNRMMDDCGFVISVTTEAGLQQARKSFPEALEIFFSPLDFYPCIVSALKRIRPVAILIIETGFWPNLIHCGRRLGALTVLVNGRISRKSYRRYQAIAPFSRPLFNRFHFVIARDVDISKKFQELGTSEGKIFAFGDMKYDTLLQTAQVDLEALRGNLTVQEGTRCITAGNTHEGEEEFLLDIFDELRSGFKNLLLVLAPRRLERLPRIEKMLRDRGRAYVRRTSLKQGFVRKADLILLDTIGELSRIYFISDIIFVGRSIFPPGGGHSLLEPVAAGKVAFHGPYVQYYEEARDLLREAGLAVELRERGSYIKHFKRILGNEEAQRDLGARAEDFLRKRRGASEKTAQLVKTELERRVGEHDPNGH